MSAAACEPGPEYAMLFTLVRFPEESTVNCPAAPTVKSADGLVFPMPKFAPKSCAVFPLPSNTNLSAEEEIPIKLSSPKAIFPAIVSISEGAVVPIPISPPVS